MGRFKSFLAIFAISLFTFIGQACALNVAYDFDIHAFGGHIYETGQTNYDAHRFFLSNSGSGRIEFNSSSGHLGNLTITLNGTASIRDRAIVDGRWTYLDTIVESTDFVTTLVIENASAITTPEGFIGFAGFGATSYGTTFLSDIGDATGDGVADSLQYDFMTKFMNFNSFAGTNTYQAELAHLGSNNFFLWDSEFFGSIVAKAWFQSTGNILVNGLDGNQFIDGINGDIHLKNGAEVPEPATAALLGMGLLGGAIRRKQQTA